MSNAISLIAAFSFSVKCIYFIIAQMETEYGMPFKTGKVTLSYVIINRLPKRKRKMNGRWIKKAAGADSEFLHHCADWPR